MLVVDHLALRPMLLNPSQLHIWHLHWRLASLILHSSSKVTHKEPARFSEHFVLWLKFCFHVAGLQTAELVDLPSSSCDRHVLAVCGLLHGM